MNVPWPHAWLAQLRRMKVLLALVLGLICPFTLIVGFLATSAGDYGVGLGLLLIFVVMIALSLSVIAQMGARGRGSRAAFLQESGDSSVVTVFAYSAYGKGAQWSVWATLFALFLAMPAIVDAIPNDGSPRDTTVRLVAPFFPIFALYPAGILLSRLIRKRGVLGIGLSSEGVYQWWWFGCSFFAWDSIDAVRAMEQSALAMGLDVRESAARPVNEEENVFGRWDYYRRKRRKVLVGYLGVNPAVAYLALAFYLRHPELRDELGTDASVERIRRVEFAELVKEIEQYGDLRASGRT